VLYYTRNWTRKFNIASTDHMTLLTAFTHDGAMQDIFGALLNGAVLFPLDIKTMLDQRELADFIVAQRITLWHSVPTLYRYFTDSLSGSEMFPGLRGLRGLRYIILGGEPLREHDIVLYKTFFPGAVLANVYGQTESSVNTIHLIDAGTPFTKPVLGEPLEKTGILLVDENDEILEDLGTGEIVVACNSHK
ncbi:MAG: amino acid adenylation domain-containing protein, partial [bacterium]|nr:amino acid adenylation domain-containing protein [bacterium]